MNAGELRHRITIQKLPEGQVSFGQSNDNWEDDFSVWAAVEPLVGKQYFAAESIQSEVTHKIRIRYRQGITPKMRIKFGGNRNFNIISVINYQERNIELQLMCSELL